jgi:predicted nuclease of restriction endonuclease-like (RecB) superfamily
MPITPNTFSEFVGDIKHKIRQAQTQALQSVNKQLIMLYWTIGQSIVQKQEQFGWGKSVVKELSDELQREFIGTKGFSVQNLWNMRLFFLTYQANQKLQTLSREISWSHNVKILQKIKDPFAQQFYMECTIKNRWSVRVLDHQIDNQSYEKFLINQTNFENTLPSEMQPAAAMLVKDEYTFDFLELNDQHTEKELESALIQKIREFLIQMGSDFSFMGNQYKLIVDDEEYFIDLMLYHRRLKALIAIELKIGKFKPEYAGKMGFYLTALNETVKLPDENPSIGIIVCKEKQRTTVEFSLRNESLIIPESMAQDFVFTGVLGKQAHSWLRN